MVEAEMRKLFLSDINPDLSERTLRSEVAQLVHDEVLRAEVQVKQDKNGRKATGVIHFATWNAAARAKSTLRRHARPPISFSSVTDYKEHTLHESGCAMFSACFVLLVLTSVIFLASGLSLKTEQPMIAFTEQPMHYLDANVLRAGRHSRGGEDQWGAC